MDFPVNISAPERNSSPLKLFPIDSDKTPQLEVRYPAFHRSELDSLKLPKLELETDKNFDRNNKLNESIERRAQKLVAQDQAQRWKEAPFPNDYYGKFSLDSYRLDYKPVPFCRTFTMAAPPAVGLSVAIGMSARLCASRPGLVAARPYLLSGAVAAVGVGQFCYDGSNLLADSSILSRTKYGLSLVADTGMISGGITGMIGRSSRVGAAVAIGSIAARALIDLIPDKVTDRYPDKP